MNVLCSECGLPLIAHECPKASADCAPVSLLDCPDCDVNGEVSAGSFVEGFRRFKCPRCDGTRKLQVKPWHGQSND